MPRTDKRQGCECEMIKELGATSSVCVCVRVRVLARCRVVGEERYSNTHNHHLTAE